MLCLPSAVYLPPVCTCTCTCHSPPIDKPSPSAVVPLRSLLSPVSAPTRRLSLSNASAQTASQLLQRCPPLAHSLVQFKHSYRLLTQHIRCPLLVGRCALVATLPAIYSTCALQKQTVELLYSIRIQHTHTDIYSASVSGYCSVLAALSYTQNLPCTSY